MKIAIMQPYLFPYIGYFQLINAVDYFGIGDDVQFIKSGWINRNRILVQGESKLFTFSVKKDSFDKNIKERFFSDNFEKEKEKFLRKLEIYYKKAPFYSETYKIVKSIFDYEEKNVSKFIQNQLKIICNYIYIDTPFVNSLTWKIENDTIMNVEERAIKKIEKLKKMKINHFVNSIGGSHLYTKDFFEKNKIKLSFLKPQEISYQQFNNEFIQNLSIIDVLMFNSPKTIKYLLTKYDLT